MRGNLSNKIGRILLAAMGFYACSPDEGSLLQSDAAVEGDGGLLIDSGSGGAVLTDSGSGGAVLADSGSSDGGVSSNGMFTEDFNSGNPNFSSPSGRGPHGALAAPSYSNGRAYPNPALVDTSANANVTYGPDHFSEATLYTGAALTDYVGITVRADISDPNYYWYKFEMQPGGSMRIASLFHDPAVPNHGFGQCGSNYSLQTNSQYRLRLEIRGQTLIGYVNATPVLQCRDTTHRQITRGGTPGIILWGTNTSLDNFAAGNLSGVPAPNVLPALQTLTIALDR